MTTKSLAFVLIQLFLFVVFATLPVKDSATLGWQLTSLCIVIAGAIITAVALFSLGPGLTPFPVPRIAGKLITTGIYKWARHPIYTGLLLITSGITIYSFSISRALITVLLLVLFYYKSVFEESLLLKKFPEYQDYKSKTGRFFTVSFKN